MAGGTPSTSVWHHVVSLQGRASGLRYFEVELTLYDNPDGFGNTQIGLTTDNPAATTGPLSASGSAAMIWQAPAGYVTRDTPSFFNIGAALAAGDVVKGAVNFTTGKVWMGKVGGAWIGGGDPAAGTSETMTFSPGTWYIASCAGGTDAYLDWGVRIRTGASQFTGVVPTGFVAWAA